MGGSRHVILKFILNSFAAVFFFKLIHDHLENSNFLTFVEGFEMSTISKATLEISQKKFLVFNNMVVWMEILSSFNEVKSEYVEIG